MNKFKKLIIISAMSAMFFPVSAYAAEKNVSATLDKDYTTARFTIEFEEPGEYDVTVSDEKEKHVYEAEQTDPKHASVIVQDPQKGKWNIKITTEDIPEEGDELSEDDVPEEGGEDGAEPELIEREIGPVHVSIEGSYQDAVDMSDDIKVAQDIAGLLLYFKDSAFVAEWTEGSTGDIDIEITDAKTQQKLVSERVNGGKCEFDIDTKEHEKIVVTLVPSESSRVEGAAQSWTLTTKNEPDAEVTYENITITNKDSIKAFLTLGKAYKVDAYCNDELINEAGELNEGEHELDLATVVGDNNFLIYLTDPVTHYMKSYTYYVEKDVVAPVFKFVKSYENITTKDETIEFEGSIDLDYESFTINDKPIKVEGDHTWKYIYALKEGENNIHIEARDAAGNISDYNTVVTRIIPKVAKVPWFPVILGVCTLGLGVTYIVMAILRRKKQYDDYDDEVFEREEKEQKGAIGRKYDVIPIWLQEILRIGLPLAFIFITLNYIVLCTTVMSGSMEPKLGVGNTVAFNRLAYLKHEPERGDIITFWSEEYGKYMSKRVIGIPGDTIEFHSGYVYINGMIADESEYLAENIETNSNKVFTVPDKTVFLLGDNREYSNDSRFWKQPFISYDDIKGKYMGQVGFSAKYLIMEKMGKLDTQDDKDASSVDNGDAPTESSSEESATVPEP